MIMLEVRLKKSFGEFCLNLAFQADNEILALLGASGSGKSMTLKCIAGVEQPEEGRIVLDGTVLFDSEQKINLLPQKRKTGYLFQNYALFPNMTVEDNIAAGIHRPKHERGAMIQTTMQALHLNGLEKRYPGQLSGGQQQRVALARILASEPKLLMLDEPFSALDSHLRWQMEQELGDILKRFGGTTLYVSHNRDEVYRLCGRIAVISGGRLEALDEKWSLFQNPRKLSAALLTGCKNISAAEKLSDHTLKALDWNTVLTSEQPVPNHLQYIGIRAHYWIPVDAGNEENVIKGEISRIIEDTFSYIVLYHCTGTEGEKLIRWEMPKQNSGFKKPQSPVYLKVLPKDILLMTG
jgi:molybdate transport system ATP-binding protein